MSGQLKYLKKSLKECSGYVNDHDYTCKARPCDVRLALKLIDDLTAQLKWNNVNDCKPPLGMDVLVVSDYTLVGGSKKILIDRYIQTTHTTYWWSGSESITHWITFPDFPEEKQCQS